MTEWETAWAGLGQPVGEHESPPGPQATVYQMALVAAGIANKGTIMRPYIVDHIVAADGQRNILNRTIPQQLYRACSPAIANKVQAAMLQAVESGSGAAAKVKDVKVAGKTGTAEVGSSRPNNAWFIGYAPADNPTVAICVLVEGGGQGGKVAAPAAKPVIEAALKAQKERQ
jgi:peptidoglycan glycosyltransferase